MIRLFTLGLAFVWILGTACGSAQVVAPAESRNQSAQAAEQTNATPNGQLDYKNTLKWSTASEVDNFGFDVYRAASEDGPFVRLNASPVPGAGTSDLPAYYEYVDDTIDPGSEYFYYVESISLGGGREKFTPTFHAAPKIAQKDSEGED